MKLLFVSLGCDKNLVDSEVMLGLIRDRGWEITDDENEAEAVVVNTCCFIHDAKEESINTLIEIGELKKTGKVKVLVAAGCLAQRYHDEIKEELPEVDAIIGTTAYEHIVEAVETAWNGKNYEKLEELSYLPKNETTRITTTGGHYAYLKIAEG
ncbi:MAG: 30S ribosomal protein S12 methylthiotransferase RimO, partial [Acetivibrio ethanolgignens]